MTLEDAELVQREGVVTLTLFAPHASTADFDVSVTPHAVRVSARGDTLERSFDAEIDPDATRADFVNGVLDVVMPLKRANVAGGER